MATEDLCPHRWAVGKNGDGWVLEHDLDSPHLGRWVDSNPDCRRPAYTEDERHVPHGDPGEGR